jgi:hypothetical protein
MAIRHKNKVGYLTFLEFKKKIQPQHHSPSPCGLLSVEGGGMVKEWDFEAGFFFLNLKE